MEHYLANQIGQLLGVSLVSFIPALLVIVFAGLRSRGALIAGLVIAGAIALFLGGAPINRANPDFLLIVLAIPLTGALCFLVGKLREWTAKSPR